MKNFPQPLHREKQSKVVLDEQQREWFCRYYPVTETPRMAKAMGCSESTVTKVAREQGLVKSKAGMAAIRKRQQKRATKTNHLNGCYDRKRGHPCSAATMEGNRKRWQDEHDGKRENAMLRLKRDEPKRYAAWVEAMSLGKKELIRKEARRIMYGLERKSKLNVVVMCPFTQSQRSRRSNALKRGYLLDADCSEGTAGRYVIYYDDETQRSAKFEANCIADGFRFVRDDG